jgi:hypothetical protein
VADSRKHHYVPQSLLRQFSSQNDGQQIYVFDKTKKVSFPSSILNAGSENHFNTLTIKGIRINFEPLFQYNDDRLSVLIKKITTDRSLIGLTAEDRLHISYIIGAQIIRTKMYRTSIHSVASQLSDALQDVGINPTEIKNLSIPTEDEVRKTMLLSYLDIDKIADTLSEKVLLLINCKKGDCFWISDNPVVRHNLFPYGEHGFDAPGIEIYFPISSELALGFLCPSILRRVEIISHKKQSVLKNSFFEDLLNGEKKGIPVSLGPQTAVYLNSLQVLNSSRFIYSSSNDFSLANNILEKSPDSAKIETMVKVGKMGRGPEPLTKMPKGIYAVVYGNIDHYMLPVSKWTETGGFLEFETNDINLLNLILNDQPLKQVILYEDGRQRRGPRDVKFELSNTGSSAHVIVKHREEIVNHILNNHLN